MRMQMDCREQPCYKYSCSSEQALAASVGAIQQSFNGWYKTLPFKVMRRMHQRVSSDRDVSTSGDKSLERLSRFEN